MATKFGYGIVKFPAGTGTARELRVFRGSVVFDRVVRDAGVALNGYKFDFVNTAGTNRPMNVIEVNVNPEGWVGNNVNFNVVCQYADANFDDKYSGYVKVLAIAELA